MIKMSLIIFSSLFFFFFLRKIYEEKEYPKILSNYYQKYNLKQPPKIFSKNALSNNKPLTKIQIIIFLI